MNGSDVIRPAIRTRTASERVAVDATLTEPGERGALRKLPAGFAAGASEAEKW